MGFGPPVLGNPALIRLSLGREPLGDQVLREAFRSDPATSGRSVTRFCE